MDRKAFQKAVNRSFYPALKRNGFAGSGSTRRRVAPPVIHVVNVQGSQWGMGFYINLAVHLLGLPTVGGGLPKEQPMEHECIVRHRLDPPQDVGVGMWPYGESAEDAERISRRLAEEVLSRGESLLASHSRYPEDFVRMVNGAAAGGSRVHSLPMITLAEFLAMPDAALQIAQNALADCPPTATTLRSKLEEFLHSRKAV